MHEDWDRGKLKSAEDLLAYVQDESEPEQEYYEGAEQQIGEEGDADSEAASDDDGPGAGGEAPPECEAGGDAPPAAPSGTLVPACLVFKSRYGPLINGFSFTLLY